MLDQVLAHWGKSYCEDIVAHTIDDMKAAGAYKGPGMESILMRQLRKSRDMVEKTTGTGYGSRASAARRMLLGHRNDACNIAT